MAVLDLPVALRSSVALSLDVLEAANRAAAGRERASGGRRRASRASASPFAVRTVTPGARLPPKLAVLVVPGLGCASEVELDAALRTDAARWAVDRVRRAHARGTYVATSCAGVFLAAEAGILDGQAATTSWFLEAALRERHPSVAVRPHCILVESRGCLTGGAALAHAEVMLALVERFCDAEVADLTARYLLLDRRRSQRPYVLLTALLQNDPQLLRAEAHVREHAGSNLTVGDVARAAGLGERTLARRLKRTCDLSPVRFIQRIRMDVARRHLAAGLSFEAVATEVGYSDASALRRVFRQH